MHIFSGLLKLKLFNAWNFNFIFKTIYLVHI